MTRRREQAGEMVRMLQEAGAEVVGAPAIETAAPADWAPVDRAVEEAGGFDWVVFSSANGVEWFFGRMRSLGVDVNLLRGVKVAAVGPGTAEKVASYSVDVDLCPDRRLAEGMVDAFAAQGSVAGMRFLIPRPEAGRQALPRGLRKMGAEVEEVVVYRTVRPAALPAEALARLDAGQVDMVTFTSSSTARNFADLLGPERFEAVRRRVRAACIGPETSRTARGLGFEVVAEPDERDISAAGLVRAIVAYFGRQGRGGTGATEKSG